MSKSGSHTVGLDGEGDVAARLVVDLAALAANWRAIASATAAEVAGVVKADGYGLGAAKVARTLHAAGCRTFFTAFTREAVALRRVLADVDIFVLMPLVADEAHVLRAHRLTPCLFDCEGIHRWIESSVAQGAPAHAALHVETGIHRLGLSPEALAALLADDTRRSRLDVTLLMSHLACADTPAAPANRRQLDRFRAIRDAFPGARASFANSAGTFLAPEYHFDMVRPGIALYGHDPHCLPTAPRVQPVATLEAQLGQIATVEPGESVGYGAVATCDTARRIGVVLAGYADGIPRSLYRPDRRFEVMVGGHRVPLFGTVSMDMMTIDLSEVPEDAVEVGAWVEVFGANASIERVAEQAGTIPYEILTGIGSRVERVYGGLR
ncbi:MAG: alanine racemase [Thiotrichales bacterium]|nr:alanine racemase [Thiotrichales bacterium]